MLADWQFAEKCERYLKGEMNPQEALEFEKLIRQNPAYLDEMLDQKTVSDVLKRLGERKKVRNLLSKIMNEGNAPKTQTPRGKIIRLNSPVWRTALVAAGISMMIAVSTVFIFNSFIQNPRATNAKFRALRKDLDNIRSSQSKIIRDLNTKSKPDQRVTQANAFATGFALTTDGLFATSMHVIKGADSIFIQNKQGQTFKAIPVYRDQENDIALLQVIDTSFKPLKKIPYVLKEKESELGEQVFTLGYPRDEMVFGEGSVSAASGFQGDTGSYQISIPLNPGNSGGPLFDLRGNLIGIISGQQTETESAAFAVKSTRLAEILKNIPQDSLDRNPQLNKKNSLSGLNRVEQIKNIENCIVVIRVFERED
jgi:S1-C subfamily serine protease